MFETAIGILVIGAVIWCFGPPAIAALLTVICYPFTKRGDKDGE